MTEHVRKIGDKCSCGKRASECEGLAPDDTPKMYTAAWTKDGHIESVSFPITRSGEYIAALEAVAEAAQFCRYCSGPCGQSMAEALRRLEEVRRS